MAKLSIVDLVHRTTVLGLVGMSVPIEQAQRYTITDMVRDYVSGKKSDTKLGMLCDTKAGAECSGVGELAMRILSKPGSFGVAALTSKSSQQPPAPLTTTDLLDEHVLEAGTPYDSPEWSPGTDTPQVETLENLKRRLATFVKTMLMPYVLGETPAHIVIVSSAIVLNELLQQVLQLNLASVTDPDSSMRSMHLNTMPLIPASYHRLEISVDGDVIGVRVLTIGETAHLQDSAPMSPLAMSPDALRSSPVASRISSPDAGAARSESRYMSALRIFTSSPHSKARTESNTPSILHGRHGRHSQSESRSATPVYGGVRSLAQYDASAMVRSITKFDPAPGDSDVSDAPESPSLPFGSFRSGDVLSHVMSGQKNTAQPWLNKWSGEAITAASSLVSLPSSISRSSISSAQPSGQLVPPQGTLHNMSAFAQNLFGHSSAQPQDGSSGRGALLWSTICIRILGVFNSDLSGTVEEVNDMYDKYIYAVFERDPASAISMLEDGFRKIIDIGLVSITQRLQGPASDDFLWRLVDVWAFYIGTVVPYVHAYALPLRTTAMHLAKTYMPAVPVDEPLSESDSEDELPRPKARVRKTVLLPRTIEVRSILLGAFRDRVILPIYDWLQSAIGHVHNLSNNSMLHGRGPAALSQLRAHLSQLTGMLTSVASNDGAQDAMEQLRDTLLQTDYDGGPHQ
ncbi:hypothetical protein MCUN1_000526 [Malassezia cuniculi]|uniref:Uncharacterized protein n=1 Tax=Malassezia cuniculi TaxID=948313 RepID=A0AAF0EW26_9BASI|nr:hypothetical protein MCUN1_000526 [Malassezia cuniculi]